MTLSLATSSSGIPTMSASTTSKIIWSVGFLSLSLRTLEVVVSTKRRMTPSYLMLSILAAFWIASSKLLPYRHHLAYRLHGRPDDPRGALELLGVPPGHLHHDIVERGLEHRRRHARHLVLQLGEGVPQADLRRDVRDGVPGRLRGQRGRPREPGVDLDRVVRLGAAARARTACCTRPLSRTSSRP